MLAEEQGQELDELRLEPRLSARDLVRDASRVSTVAEGAVASFDGVVHHGVAA